MVTVNEIYNLLDKTFPFENQESFDNSGILINAGNPTNCVVCCLDVTKEAVDIAVENNCKIIVSHHPVIYSPLRKLDRENIVFKLIQNGISVISAHTNFDKYEYGTCYNLAEFCGIEGVIEYKNLGIVITLDEECDFDGFLKNIKQKTGITLQYTKGKDTVSKIFVIAGGGGGMTGEVFENGCDCFISGESKYHDVKDMKDRNVSSILLCHDESEKISVETFEKLLKENFKDLKVISYIQPAISQFI